MRYPTKSGQVQEYKLMSSFTLPTQLRACLFALLNLSSRLLSVSIGIDIRFAHCRRLVPPVLWLLVICVCFPSITYASSPPANDVHICEVLDYEAIRARDSLYVATKQALNLNVGEPRTVRMIYFLPNNRSFRQEVVDRMKVTIRQIQTFFAEQMRAHGYGNKTFRFETDAQGEPIVHRVDDLDGSGTRNEFYQAFDTNANIYLIVVDNGTSGIEGAGGFGSRRGKTGGTATVPSEYHWRTVAHELGHAFGLPHDFRDGNYIMSYGPRREDQLSACATEFLSVHPYFNLDIPDEETPPPTIELISSQTYPSGSKSISIQLKVSDLEGLHQVLLSVSAAGYRSTVKACHGLKGERDAVVEFEYDGAVPNPGNPKGTQTSLSNPSGHAIYVDVVDINGNVGSASFRLWDASTTQQLIATLEGHTNRVYSVSFSPNGTIFASASRDGTVKLWDVVTRENIATFRGGSNVSFSPDGSILAAGGGSIQLWDVVMRIDIATLRGGSAIASMAFSSDGLILASGLRNNTIELWDVVKRENIATLEGHTDQVVSVSFSPDGTILASASQDRTVKLWDVATRTNIATLRGGSWSGSVSFSPDGSILAYGSSIHKLWDVATRREISTFGGFSREVKFSPDGSILASVSGATVMLWDMVIRENRIGNTLIATLGGHTGPVHSVSFSPDGTMLVSGSWDNSVKLWDMSLYVTPVVNISDVNLRAVIRDALGKSRFAPITVTDMASLTTLDASNRNIRELDGLEFATNLTALNLKDNPLSSLSRDTHIPALQERGIEVLFGKSLTPDFDGDGVVGIPDFLQFVDQFGFSQGDVEYDARYDLDGDGVIGVGDFLIFVDSFGNPTYS